MSTKLTNTEIVATGDIRPYIWAEKTGIKDSKKMLIFDHAEKIINTYAKFADKPKKLEAYKKSDEFKETKESIEGILKAMSQGGPLLFSMKSATSTGRMYKSLTNEVFELVLVSNAGDITKKEFKGDLSFLVKFTKNSEDGRVLVNQIADKMYAYMTSIVNVLSEEGIKLGYESPINPDGSFYLNIVFEKARGGDGKFVSNGYPKLQIANGKLSKRTKVYYEKKKTHEKVIHQLFGLGSVIRCSIRPEWTLSKNKVNLKFKISGTDMVLFSKPIDKSCVAVANEKFGTPEGFEEDVEEKLSEDEGTKSEHSGTKSESDEMVDPIDLNAKVGDIQAALGI